MIFVLFHSYLFGSFITSILKSLAIPAILLALSSVIYSRNALFFVLYHLCSKSHHFCFKLHHFCSTSYHCYFGHKMRCKKTSCFHYSANRRLGPLSIYYKLAIFICLRKAFHDRLPVTLIDLISKKRVTNYSTRTCASLIVPRFNTRYMKDSVAFRGSVLWNAVTNNCSALTKNIPYRDLRLKLKSQANFNEFSFKITSASTCNFRKDDFVYT